MTAKIGRWTAVLSPGVWLLIECSACVHIRPGEHPLAALLRVFPQAKVDS